MKYNKEHDEVSLDAELKGLLFKELDTLNTSSHDLLQEKKRVWNELEMSIKELNIDRLKTTKTTKKSWQMRLMPTFALSVLAMVSFVVINNKKSETIAPDTALVISKLNHTLETEYRLPQVKMIANNTETRLPETLSSRIIKDFEKQNQLFFRRDLQISDLRKSIERESIQIGRVGLNQEDSFEGVNLVFVNNDY